MRKVLIILLLIFSFIFFPKIIEADSYGPGYSEWSEEKTGNYGEIEKIQYGYQKGTYKDKIEESLVYDNNIGLNYYRKVFKYEYLYKQEYETRDVPIIDTKAKDGIVFKKNLDGYHLLELTSDIDMAKSSDWSNYYQPCVEVYDDSGLLFQIQKRGKDIGRNGHYSGDIIIKGNLYLYAYGERDNGRDWTGSGGKCYIKSYIEKSRISNWVYLEKDIEDCISIIKVSAEGYVEPIFDEPTGWRFDEPYNDLINDDEVIKAVERKVYSYPLEYKINYHLNGGQFQNEYTKTYHINDDIDLISPYKKGNIFIGWYLDEDLVDGPILKIPSNYIGDLDLYAKYEPKPPEIIVDRRYIFKDGESIKDISHLLKLVKATDDLDGDITNKVIIKKIKYVDVGEEIDSPSNFHLDLGEKIDVLFYVINSQGAEANLLTRFYIIGDGKNINLKIYSRYINSEYLYTLSNNSRWRINDYNEILMKYINLMKGNK